MTALAAWLWQGAAIALTTVALLGLMPRLNAATRHAIWWCALAAVLAAPLLRHLLGVAAVGERAIGPISAGVLVVPSIPDWAVAAAIGTWLGTVLVGFVKIGIGLRTLAQLKASSQPLDAARVSCLVMWQSKAPSRRRPELRVSARARAACALGLRRPMILLAHRLAAALDDEGLDQIVMHEHAHLLRYDDWLRLLEAAIVAVAGLHPAVWFISRQIDLEREAACDDAVVTRTGGAQRYAAYLADAAAIACSTTREESQLVPSATGASVSLRARVVRLLDPRRRRGARLAPLATATGLLMLACTIAVSYHTAPILIVTDLSLKAPAVARPGIAVRLPLRVADSADVGAPAAAVPSTGGAGSRRAALQRQAPIGEARKSAAPAPLLIPSDVVSELAVRALDNAPIPLTSSSISATVQVPHSMSTSVVPAAGARNNGRDHRVKWSALGAPGVAIGRGARSIGGFFGGAAKAVGTTF